MAKKVQKKAARKEKTKKVVMKSKVIKKKVVQSKVKDIPEKVSKATRGKKEKKQQNVEISETPKAYAAYTVDQYKAYKQHIAELNTKSNDELKSILVANNQSRTGNKNELVLKIADGMVLGSIPRCPNCHGGRPRFNQSNGTYNCPGYRDDTDFRNCHKKFTQAEIVRIPWVTFFDGLNFT